MNFPSRPAHGITLAVQRLCALRWWLIAGECLAILAAQPLLQVALPRGPMLLVLLLQAGANGLLRRRIKAFARLAERDLFVQLLIDMLALSVLMLLSGGAANPLISLLLVPVAIAALSLSPKRVLIIASLSVLAYSALNFAYLPLPIGDVARAARLHLAGMWLTFVASVVLLAWFVVRLTASIRQRDAELAAAREQTLRDEQMIALGTLAAGAAHELSTPLSTIAVLAGELGGEARLDATMQADIALLQKQVATCKAIISRMTDQTGVGRLESVVPVNAVQWLRAAHTRWLEQRPGVSSRLHFESPDPAPSIIADPTLEQALLSLFNNAANAGSTVTVTARWPDGWLSIEVRDDGPGLPTNVIENAGRAPLPPHASGSGLGLYLAHAAIGRLGGQLRLYNDHGGVAEIRLPASPAH